jgi:hypothetical protein
MKTEMSQWRIKAMTFHQLQDMGISGADLTRGFLLITIYGMSRVRNKYLSGVFN